MKKIAFALLLSAFVAAPAVAADGKNSVGINYGLDLDGVFGIQGEFDISSMVNKAPVSVQVFWKSASQSVLGGTADTTGLGVAGIYDLSALVKLDKKIQPYAGLGFVRETAKVSTTIPFFGTVSATATKTELYYTVGAKYSFTPQLSGDLNLNQFGGLTIGVDFSF